MTPEEFRQAVEKALEKEDEDVERSHISTDELMEECLRSLGYGEGIDLIEKSRRWYA